MPMWLLKFMFYVYPPYWGTGFRIKTISKDYRFIEVYMKLRWYNKNYVGTHFGGAIYSMIDPFYMLILMKNLGKDYLVWDKAAYIEFKKPGRGTLRASFTFSEEEITAIRKQVDANEKFVFDKPVDIFNEDGIVVASVVKTLYVGKKRR